MMKWLPVLILFVGLGSSISNTQSKLEINPFQRYLAGLKANRPEAALIRFASECGVDINLVSPKYAQNPAGTWIPHKDLSRVFIDQETDSYATAAVWHIDDIIMVEYWGMVLDTGNYYRTYSCLQNRVITFEEETDWLIPPLTDERERGSYPAWGLEQHRQIGKDGKYEIVSHHFVDAYGRPIKAPKLNADDEEYLKDFQRKPNKLLTWTNLSLPQSLLQ